MKSHVCTFSYYVSIVLAVGIGSNAPEALAQEGEGLSIDTFKPSSSTGAIFEMALPTIKEHLRWTVGGLIHYAHEPVRRVVTNTETDTVELETYPVNLRLTADLYAAVGFWDVVELGLALPVIAYQDGEIGSPRESIQSAGLGDPRIEAKGKFLDVKGFSLGAGAILTAPIGNYASSGRDFMGSKYPTFEPKIIAAYNVKKLTAAVNVGFLLRKEESLGNYEQRHALSWNVGAAYDIFDFYDPGGLRVALEANSNAGINFDTLTETPIEVLLGAKYRTKQDLIVTAGAGPGASTAVGTPSFRVFVGLSYDPIIRNCPAGPEDFDGFEDDDMCIDPDNDSDDILDVDDKCPNDPEDKDKFEDEDGCPELDNDGDKIEDKVDACPMIPEDFDDFKDEDGCPEEGPKKAEVKVTDSQILISSKIYFDFDKETIKEISFSILDAVATALVENPGIKKLQIEGHTDNEGTEEYNQELSENRAKAVMEYLIDKKTDPERLTYKGFGFSKPKASNETEEGKAINRRVEFTIIEKEQK